MLAVNADAVRRPEFGQNTALQVSGRTVLQSGSSPQELTGADIWTESGSNLSHRPHFSSDHLIWPSDPTIAFAGDTRALFSCSCRYKPGKPDSQRIIRMQQPARQRSGPFDDPERTRSGIQKLASDQSQTHFHPHSEDLHHGRRAAWQCLSSLRSLPHGLIAPRDYDSGPDCHRQALGARNVTTADRVAVLIHRHDTWRRSKRTVSTNRGLSSPGYPRRCQIVQTQKLRRSTPRYC